LAVIKDISFQIGEIVAQIDNSLEGVYDALNGVTEVCKTKYARVGKTIQDEMLNVYVISEVEDDTYIKAGTANGKLYLNNPYYISGTQIAANREWSIFTDNLENKTPLIWLLNDIRYTQYGRDSTIDWESELRIFFLDETNITDYYSADHVTNVVEPMSELCTLFIQAINKNRKFQTIESYEVKNFTRFGIEEASGYFRNILDANLSGVELQINLVRYKENCKC